MKKFILILAISMIMILTGFQPGFADTPCISSGARTVDGNIYTGPCELCGVFIQTDGANPAIMVGIYDNDDAASGNLLMPQITVAATNHYGGFFPNLTIKAEHGLYLDAGTNLIVIVYYRVNP